MRVICAGHVNWDVTLHVDHLPEPDGEADITRQTQSGGGSASNAAVALAGLGAEPLVLGSIGHDEHGFLARRDLTDAGVDTRLVESSQPTAVKYLIVDENGAVAVLGNDGANEAFEPADLPPAALADADHLHLTSQEPGTAAALAREAVAAGVPVSFDPGRRVAFRDYSDALSHAEILFCNEREADHVREGGVLDAVPTVVVKRGAGGAAVHTADRTVTASGFDVDPVDTTGAGDAFAAGYLVARNRGADFDRALAVANACGALATRKTGARVTLDWSDVTALLDGNRPEQSRD